jgi:hypothetical protein
MLRILLEINNSAFVCNLNRNCVATSFGIFKVNFQHFDLRFCKKFYTLNLNLCIIRRPNLNRFNFNTDFTNKIWCFEILRFCCRNIQIFELKRVERVLASSLYFTSSIQYIFLLLCGFYLFKYFLEQSSHHHFKSL